MYHIFMNLPKDFDAVSLFLKNMRFLKKTLFGTDEVMSAKIGIRKSTLNDKLNGRSQFDLKEIQQIGEIIGIHPGLLLLFDLSDWMDELSDIKSLLDLLTIPIIYQQIMSNFESVKRLFKDDIIRFQESQRHENEDNENHRISNQAVG
jgi:hypothetical protein